MPAPDLTRAHWRKSTHSENSTGCVEIAHTGVPTGQHGPIASLPQSSHPGSNF